MNIFILDQSIQSSHIEFNTINYYNFDSKYNEQPRSEHGTHIAALIVGTAVGITQGLLNLCRYG